MYLEPGPKEMRYSERAGPCGLHTGGGARKRSDRKDCIKCGVWTRRLRVQAESKDAQTGKGHCQQLITPWLPRGCHASAQATVPHGPLKVHIGAFCLLLPYLIFHTLSYLPKSSCVTHTHFTLANAMLSKNPDASVQRIWRLPHLTPLFWKSENKRGPEKLNNCPCP